MNGSFLSEYYGQLYTDVIRNNYNEHFIFNILAQTLMSKINGQCIEAVPNTQFNDRTGEVKTAPCDYNNKLQKWNVDNRCRFQMKGWN